MEDVTEPTPACRLRGKPSSAYQLTRSQPRGRVGPLTHQLYARSPL